MTFGAGFERSQEEFTFGVMFKYEQGYVQLAIGLVFWVFIAEIGTEIGL